MEYFPIFLDLRDRRAVVLGGGAEVVRKIKLLIRAGARPLVVARKVAPEIAAWVASHRCEHWADPFEPSCLAGAAVAIAASGDQLLDIAFVTAAQVRGVPVNAVDRPELSSFIMPAIVERGPVTIAVSTGGASPTLAQIVRDRIELALPPGIGQLAWLAGKLRPVVRSCLRDPARRRGFWRAALGSVIRFAPRAIGPSAKGTLLRALGHEVRQGIQSGVVPH